MFSKPLAIVLKSRRAARPTILRTTLSLRCISLSNAPAISIIRCRNFGSLLYFLSFNPRIKSSHENSSLKYWPRLSDELNHCFKRSPCGPVNKLYKSLIVFSASCDAVVYENNGTAAVSPKNRSRNFNAFSFGSGYSSDFLLAYID